jgi:transposase
MGQVSTVGLDLAKNVFQVHGVDAEGKVIVRRSLRRAGLSDETWQVVKRDHARMIRAASAEQFVLDRLCLDDDAPLSSEVERVRAALERVAGRTCLSSVQTTTEC